MSHREQAENISRSHAIIADLQALHRLRKLEETDASRSGKMQTRSRQSMALELRASRHGASGEAIQRAGTLQNIYANFSGRINAISGFYADLTASKATV